MKLGDDRPAKWTINPLFIPFEGKDVRACFHPCSSVITNQKRKVTSWACKKSEN